MKIIVDPLKPSGMWEFCPEKDTLTVAPDADWRAIEIIRNQGAPDLPGNFDYRKINTDFVSGVNDTELLHRIRCIVGLPIAHGLFAELCKRYEAMLEGKGTETK